VSTPGCATIEALSAFLGLGSQKTAKALMYVRATDERFVIAVIRGDMQLSEAKLAALVGELRPASPEQIDASGAVAGYASPIGLTDALVVVDDQVPNSPNLVAGANEAGFHFENTNCGRDYHPELVADLSLTRPGDACPECGSSLTPVFAILLKGGDGYKFDEILRAVAETFHDEHGLRLPASAAPFDVFLLHIPSNRADTLVNAERIYQVLESEGLRVLFDDRDKRAGVKFNDADLIGCPVRITVSEKHLTHGMVEWKRRDQDGVHVMRLEDAVRASLSPDRVLP
jgi:prolyl-tRNA synthetase